MWSPLQEEWSSNINHKGGRQLTHQQWKRFFKTIDTYGIMSDQPSKMVATDLGDGATLIYFPEIRKDDVTPVQIYSKKEPTLGKLLDAITQNQVLFDMTTPPFSQYSNPMDSDFLSSRGYIIMIGVSYPANPLLIVPDRRGNYMISTSGYEQQMTEVYPNPWGKHTWQTDPKEMKKRISPKELDKLVSDTVYLFNTPVEELKQSDSDVWSHDENRYYIGQKKHEGKTYGSGLFVDIWKESPTSRDLGRILVDAFDTNGHIFVVVGNHKILQESFASINYRVIN